MGAISTSCIDRRIAFAHLSKGVVACGIPVLTSVGSGAWEVALGGRPAREPHDMGAISEGLEALASQSQLRADLGRRGLVRTAGYSWQRTGVATRELLAKG